MSLIGYARVSTTDQDFKIQIDRLKAAGCEVVRSEAMSGSSRDGRSELATVMEFLGEGDELVVLRLDRLGRSTRDVLNLVHELDAKGASLRVLEPEVTTAGDMGRMVVTVLGLVADLELKFIRDRQRAGIEAAKARGAYRGRRKSVDDGDIRCRIEAGVPKAQIARDLGISRMSVYRALAKTQMPQNVVEVDVHVIATPFTKYGRGDKKLYPRIEAMLDELYGLSYTERGDWRFSIDLDARGDDFDLEAEMSGLGADIVNLAVV